MRKTSISLSFVLVATAIVFNACKKEATQIDLDLLNMAQVTTGFTWYKNSDAWLQQSSGSAHDYDNLRTRYNAVAASQLDADGKVMANASFPEESLVVKELSDGNSAERYAILYKKSDNEHADSNGWVWGYVDADGSVVTTAEDRGIGCNGCHSQSDNIDYMLMNKFFP